jgi:hypothetical protein
MTTSGRRLLMLFFKAQRDYYSVVAPRTARILKRWPEVKTVSAVFECLKSVSPSEFLNWSDTPSSSSYLAHRVRRFVEILTLLRNSASTPFTLDTQSPLLKLVQCTMM